MVIDMGARPGPKKEIIKYYIWYQLRLKLETYDSDEMDNKLRELLQKYGGDIRVEVATTSITTIDYEAEE